MFAPGKDRSCDLRITRPTLYRLSHKRLLYRQILWLKSNFGSVVSFLCAVFVKFLSPEQNSLAKRALSSLIHACKKISFQILSGRSVKTTDTKTRTMARSCLALRKQHSQTTQSPWPAMHVAKACTLLTAECFCLFC